MSIRRRVLAVALAAIAVATVAEAPNSMAQAKPTKIGGKSINPDATLRVALRRASILDPALAPTTSDEQAIDMIYDKLFRIDDGDVTGELVSSYAFVKGGLQLEVRPNVKFQDGTKLDAAAVKTNIDRGRTLATSTLKGDLAPIQAVDVRGPMTVFLRTAQQDVSLPYVLSTRAGAMVSPAQIASGKNINLNPVGAGPFKMVRLNSGSSMTLSRWDGYWKPSIVGVQTLQVKFLPDASARINAVRSGAVDIAELQPDQINDVQRAGLVANVANLTAAVCLQINQNNVPAYKSMDVRRAINYGINREGIVNAVLEGRGQPTSQLFGPTTPYYDKELGQYYKYDKNKAMDLLDKAGYPNGFSMTILRGEGVPSLVETEAVAGSLQSIGIRARVQTLSGNEPINRMWTQKSADALVQPCNTQIDAMLALPAFLPGNLRNPGNLTSGLVTSNQSAALRTPNRAQRVKLLKDINKELTVNPLGMIAMYNTTGQFGLSKKVVGFVEPPSNYYTFRNVGIAK